MLLARVDAPGKEWYRTPGMRKQYFQLRKPIEQAGEVHPREGDGGFEREAEGEGEDVSAFLGAVAEDWAGETVVRVDEEEGRGFFCGLVDGVEFGVVETCAEAGGAKDDAFTSW